MAIIESFLFICSNILYKTYIFLQKIGSNRLHGPSAKFFGPCYGTPMTLWLARPPPTHRINGTLKRRHPYSQTAPQMPGPRHLFFWKQAIGVAVWSFSGTLYQSTRSSQARNLQRGGSYQLSWRKKHIIISSG